MVGGKSSIGSEASILGASLENGWYNNIVGMANATGLCVRLLSRHNIENRSQMQLVYVEGMRKGWVDIERTIISKNMKVIEYNRVLVLCQTRHTFNSVLWIDSVFGIL